MVHLTVPSQVILDGDPQDFVSKTSSMFWSTKRVSRACVCLTLVTCKTLHFLGLSFILFYSTQMLRPFRVCWRVQGSWDVYVWARVISSTYSQWSGPSWRALLISARKTIGSSTVPCTTREMSLLVHFLMTVGHEAADPWNRARSHS